MLYYTVTVVLVEMGLILKKMVQIRKIDDKKVYHPSYNKYLHIFFEHTNSAGVFPLLYRQIHLDHESCSS